MSDPASASGYCTRVQLLPSQIAKGCCPLIDPSSPSHISLRTLKIFALFVSIACAVLCVLVVQLSIQVKDLRTQLARVPQAHGPEGLLIGETLPPLIALGRDKSPTPDQEHNLLSFSDGRLATVLIALGGACSMCEERLSEFDALAAQYKNTSIVVAAIQIDTASPTELKAPQKNLALAYVEGSHKTWLRQIPLVPSILIFDNRGTLRAQFIGTMSPDQTLELNRLLAKAMQGWT